MIFPKKIVYDKCLKCGKITKLIRENFIFYRCTKCDGKFPVIKLTGIKNYWEKK